MALISVSTFPGNSSHPSGWCGPWKRQVTVFHRALCCGGAHGHFLGNEFVCRRASVGAGTRAIWSYKEIEMSSSSPTSLLNVDLRPGNPPMLRVEATGDAPRWAAEHRDALRAAVAEHGSLLIRGLGLRDAAETDAVFRRLASLLSETGASAPA